MRKLNYKEWIIDDMVFYVAKSRVRNMRLSLNKDGLPYAVYPYGVDDIEMRKFLIDHIKWIKNVIEKSKVKENLPDKMTFNELKDKINFYVDKYKLLLNVSVDKIGYRNMKTLWGSCTSNKKSIRFSKNLMKCNDEFIEYIVLHEMAHLIEANHSKRFWKIVCTYIPDYKERKKNYDKS